MGERAIDNGYRMSGDAAHCMACGRKFYKEKRRSMVTDGEREWRVATTGLGLDWTPVAIPAPISSDGPSTFQFAEKT
jgi:hypothetical protein